MPDPALYPPNAPAAELAGPSPQHTLTLQSATAVLEHEIERLESLVSDLVDRIGAVTEPAVPMPANPSGPTPPGPTRPVAPMAHRLDEDGSRVALVNNRLVDVLSRIAL